METPFDPCNLSKNELAAEAIRSFGALRLRVSGSSMLPAVRPGDVLLVRQCGIDAAAQGDIVVYLRRRRLFAHRVIARSGAYLATRGDTVAEPDVPVAADELLGKVVRIERRGSAVRDASRLNLAERMAAALFRRSAMAGRLFTRLQGARNWADL